MQSPKNNLIMPDSQNPFKRMETSHEVPKELKEKIMRDVNYIRFFTDIADLFSMKYAETVQTLFKTDTGKDSAKKTKDGDKGSTAGENIF